MSEETMSPSPEQLEKEAQREFLTNEHGKVWDTEEMRREFEVKGFSAGICVVRRKADNQLGSLDFTHMPRFYYDFRPH